MLYRQINGHKKPTDLKCLLESGPAPTPWTCRGPTFRQPPTSRPAASWAPHLYPRPHLWNFLLCRPWSQPHPRYPRGRRAHKSCPSENIQFILDGIGYVATRDLPGECSGDHSFFSTYVEITGNRSNAVDWEPFLKTILLFPSILLSRDMGNSTPRIHESFPNQLCEWHTSCDFHGYTIYCVAIF